MFRAMDNFHGRGSHDKRLARESIDLLLLVVANEARKCRVVISSCPGRPSATSPNCRFHQGARKDAPWEQPFGSVHLEDLNTTLPISFCRTDDEDTLHG